MTARALSDNQRALLEYLVDSGGVWEGRGLEIRLNAAGVHRTAGSLIRRGLVTKHPLPRVSYSATERGAEHVRAVRSIEDQQMGELIAEAVRAAHLIGTPE